MYVQNEFIILYLFHTISDILDIINKGKFSYFHWFLGDLKDFRGEVRLSVPQNSHRWVYPTYYIYRLKVYYDIAVLRIIICNLDFDVRVGTINRGGQTRRRTVPDCRQADCLVGDHVFVVPVATVVQQQRFEDPGGHVSDDDPRTPDHG